jgi:hypothetical protein
MPTSDKASMAICVARSVKLLILSSTVDCSCSGSALAGRGDTNTATTNASARVLCKTCLNWQGQFVKATSRQINVRTVSDACALVKTYATSAELQQIFCHIPQINLSYNPAF